MLNEQCVLNCPVCGEVPSFSDKQCRCSNPKCLLYDTLFSRDNWNKRRPEVIDLIEKATGEAWEIIDDFSLILFLNRLNGDSKFSQIYERAIHWLTEYENSD